MALGKRDGASGTRISTKENVTAGARCRAAWCPPARRNADRAELGSASGPRDDDDNNNDDDDDGVKIMDAVGD